jgi:hypothetical protein
MIFFNCISHIASKFRHTKLTIYRHLHRACVHFSQPMSKINLLAPFDYSTLTGMQIMQYNRATRPGMPVEMPSAKCLLQHVYNLDFAQTSAQE